LITTVFSENHIRHFSCCWPQLMAHSQLLPFVDVLIFSNNQSAIPDSELDQARRLFATNPSLKFKFSTLAELQRFVWNDHINNNKNETKEVIAKIASRKNPNQFQKGANLGLRLGFQYGWFDDYDWLIRINPDVLIRNSTWIVRQLLKKHKDGIFVDCRSVHNRIHTDFFAVRPKVLIRQAQVQARTKLQIESTTNASTSSIDLPFSNMSLEPWSRYMVNHEATAFKYFWPPILKRRRHTYLPDNADSHGFCRVRGPKSSVVHSHDNCKHGNKTTTVVCDALEGWTIT